MRDLSSRLPSRGLLIAAVALAGLIVAGDLITSWWCYFVTEAGENNPEGGEVAETYKNVPLIGAGIVTAATAFAIWRRWVWPIAITAPIGIVLGILPWIALDKTV